MRQLELDQLVPADPMNVDLFLTTTGRGKDVWWPIHNTTMAWRRYLSQDILLDNPRETFILHLPSIILASHSRLMRRLTDVAEEGEQGAQAELFGRISRLTGMHPPHNLDLLDREMYEDESEEERLFDHFKSLENSPVRSSPAQAPPPLPTPPPPTIRVGR
ncbi:hypothetical protein PIB30_015536 [Stylosanthes scabra]|uniref:Uncharacterized protein n=1 Tax=Stylosanthes scabra TaxID=79078 RepID=A0ABU6Z3K4_9FABA|nr:hypothetical protein [Stylosanthes scabra]